MRKLIILTFFIVLGHYCNAQYEAHYALWYDMVNPDNNQYKIIKKEGFKTLKVVSYASNDEDNNQAIAAEYTITFDAAGRIGDITFDANSTQPVKHYDYNRQGQVLRYTEATKKSPKISFDFVYDRRKGYKMIQCTDSTYQWDTIKYRLVITTDTNTQYYYFHKSGMPEKYVKQYTNKGLNKVVYKTDSVIYKYDRTDNLIEYRRITSNQRGDVEIEEIGTYTYDVKKNVLKAEINRFDYSFHEEQPRHTEVHTYTYEGDMIPILKGYAKTATDYYYADGSLMNEKSFVDVDYTLAPTGLPMNYNKRTTPPGQDVLYVFTFAK
jgi:hypothetical protein